MLASASAQAVQEASKPVIARLLLDYGTLVASATALFIAGGGGKWIKSKFYKPKLTVVEPVKFNQEGRAIWRLLIKNTGNDIARKVQVDTVAIIDPGETRPRDNFLPVPLRWTHLDKEVRDIIPNQLVYLDLVQEEYEVENGRRTGVRELRTSSRFAQHISDFIRVNVGTSRLELTIYEAKGKNVSVTVRIMWDRQESVLNLD